MTVVVGIDPALTATGLARVTARSGAASLETTTVTSAGRRADSLARRYARLDAIQRAVAAWCLPCQLAVIEGPAHAARGASVLDRHGAWWLIVVALLRAEVPVAVCAPTTRARWAAGSGRADKAAVSAAVGRLWPDWGEGPAGAVDEHRADSAALATMGAQRLALVDGLKRHAAALDAVVWPDEIGAIMSA